MEGWCGDIGKASRVLQARWKSTDRGHLSSWLSISHMSAQAPAAWLPWLENLFCTVMRALWVHSETPGVPPCLDFGSGGLQ